MTQMKMAKAGHVTEELRAVAQAENIDIEVLQDQVAKGLVVIPKNRKHEIPNPIGIGKGLC